MDDSPVESHSTDDVAEAPPRTNRFENASNLRELMNLLVAAGSSLGSSGRCANEADEAEGRKIADEAMERLKELGLTNWG
jgi:hypothetical protein